MCVLFGAAAIVAVAMFFYDTPHFSHPATTTNKPTPIIWLNFYFFTYTCSGILIWFGILVGVNFEENQTLQKYKKITRISTCFAYVYINSLKRG